MCGAPDQDTLPALEVSSKEAVVHGFVTRSGSALGGAYVRLLLRGPRLPWPAWASSRTGCTTT